MKKIVLVTTFHKEGYEKYGRRMLESFVKYAPDNVEMVAYPEDFEPDFKSPRVEYRDLHKSCPGLVLFKKKYGRMSEPRGRIFKDGAFHYSYQFDAVRFSNKIFAVAAAGKSLDADLMFWVDADVVAQKNIPPGFFESLLPDSTYTCYLGREFMYTECGFVGYNLRHPRNREFLQLMENIYAIGEVFLFPQWHDCMVYDAARQHLVTNGGLEVNNLSAHLKNCMHPFVNTQLGEYMDHLKGPQRKELGHSLETDYLNPKSQ